MTMLDGKFAVKDDTKILDMKEGVEKDISINNKAQWVALMS